MQVTFQEKYLGAKVVFLDKEYSFMQFSCQLSVCSKNKQHDSFYLIYKIKACELSQKYYFQLKGAKFTQSPS